MSDPRGRVDETGAVTAETAVVLPVLVGLALGLAWVVALAAAQVRVVDAARETARALARDERPAVAVALGHRVAPGSARIQIAEAGDEVRVTVTAPVRGPGGLLGFLPPVTVEAASVAGREPR